MHRLFAALIAVLMATTVLAAPQSSLEQRRKQLNDLIDERWEYIMEHNPEYASILGDKRFNDKLSDYSEKAIYTDIAKEKDFLKRFREIDTAGFPEQEKLNQELAIRTLELRLEGVRFRDWEMPVSQIDGIQIDMPQLVSVLPFETVKDYDDFISRLNQLPVAFNQTIDLMRKGMAERRMPPKMLLEKAGKQAVAIGTDKPEDSPFYEPAKKFPSSFSESEKKRISEQMRSVIREKVNPAYLKFARFISEEYAPQGRIEVGVWALPDGDAYYRYAVKQSTTTDLTPDQIHEIGLKEVEKDRAEMLKIANQFGFKDLKSFDEANTKNPILHPKSRQQMLDLYTKYIDQMWVKLPQFFGTLPKSKVIVMPIEEYREKEAPGAEYIDGSPDGKRPGHVMVNTGDFQSRLLTDVETTAYHEGIPGHHMQISVAQELPTLPKFRQHAFYVAYTEGWALYSEQMGVEAGFFQDPYSLYGHYQDDLLRAIRLVVDTGLHSKHWTRQQVVDYFHSNSGIDEPTVQNETDRYIAWPSQALGYKTGQLKILALREKAKQDLGPRFDIRRFNDEILNGGALPLDVLGRRIDAWTARVKNGQATASAAK